MSPSAVNRARVSLLVRGVVQGVGFRPFVHGLAARLELGGFVKNRRDGVLIEVEGPTTRVDAFVQTMRTNRPAVSRIDEVALSRIEPIGASAFEIVDSEVSCETDVPAFTPDIATCDACLTELFDPADRRFRYPFITCASCGPRLTIAKDAPYDRRRTTMASFLMCALCRAEYANPKDRRFHAQAIACPACGPRASLVDRARCSIAGDPVLVAGALLRDGAIVAVKGLGGYHLACDARNADAVRALRRRKHREEKPFAVMVPNLEAAAMLCDLEPGARAALGSPQRPIVLLARRGDATLAKEVAPGCSRVGIFLPYTPLHHLLLAAVGGRPLVMTSGNRSDEPIAFEDDEAFDRLSEIADAFVTHDRPIYTRCDDSVTTPLGDGVTMVRRSRGFVPESIRLPVASRRRLLAVGGHLKNTFAFGRDARALLGHHLGDLGDHHAFRGFREAIAHYERLFAFSPEAIVHDLHPAYASTLYAHERATQGLPLLAVQHHHAHMASCMAENDLAEPVIAVTFDGSGYGTDGTIWGGDILIGDYLGFRRAAHLRPVPLPGGEAAIREPWRMALAHLLDAGEAPAPLLAPAVAEPALSLGEQMVRRRINSPLTSSVGRLFDAVASLIGVRHVASFEAQAAIQLEELASDGDDDSPYPFALADDDGSVVMDVRPLIVAIANECRHGLAPGTIARRFHSTLAAIVDTVVRRLRETTGLDTVVLTGGVFMNRLLLEQTKRRLREARFRVYTHRVVPPNDGGLSLGQLAVGAARLSGEAVCA